MNVGVKIRELREAKGMTQSDLAEQLDVSKSTISMYERGAREPDLETLKNLSVVFNVFPTVFFIESDSELTFHCRNTDDAIIISILRKMTPGEVRRLCDFAQGMIAARPRKE